MARIQGSDGWLGKHKIAILNIDAILNNFSKTVVADAILI
jgi:hypothetical protein